MASPVRVAEALTPEWFEARKTSIGASEVAAAAGLSRYQTPLELYKRKRGEIPPIEDNRPMRMGRRLEPIIKAEFVHLQEEETGKPFVWLDANPPMYRHGVLSHISATPDAIITEDVLFEAKAASWRMKGEWGNENTDDAPTEYVCQTAQQMAVMNASEVKLAVLFDGAELKVFSVQRNEDLIKLLLDAATELWERIVDGRPPEPDWQHPSTPKLIKSMHESINDARIELDANECALWEEYESLAKSIKEDQERQAVCKAMILHSIGDNYAGILGDGRMLRRKVIEKKPYTVTPEPYVDFRAVKADSGRIVERNQPLMENVCYVPGNN